MIFDNIAPISIERINEARGALKLLDAFELGMAIIPVTRAAIDSDGVTTPAGINRVIYRALAGEVYEAKIISVRAPNLVDIDVLIPGCSEPVRLTKVRYKAE